MFKPVHLTRWISEHRDLLQPPVGNHVIFQDQEFIVMLVAGPNQRKDYHVNQGEEIFYQLEGDIILKTIQDNKLEEIPIKEGEIFLLPGNIPHSPRRPAETTGLVIERLRKPDELDGFQWYCEHCGYKLYEEYAHISDIKKQLAEILLRFQRDINSRRCGQCGETLDF